MRAQYRDEWEALEYHANIWNERIEGLSVQGQRQMTTDFHTFNATDVRLTATMRNLADAMFLGINQDETIGQMMDGLMTQEEKDTVLTLTGQLTVPDSTGTESTEKGAGKRSRTQDSEDDGNKRPEKFSTTGGDPDQ